MDEDIKPIRITVVGDGSVGKTTMLSRYVFNQLPNGYVPTVFENYSNEVTVDGKRYNLQLFDTSGQEDYDRLRILSYIERDCIIICFAVDSKTSFDNVKRKWFNDVRASNKTAKLLLVGTKSDLRAIDDNESEERELVDLKDGVKMMKKIRAKQYIECSALKNDGIQAVFAEAVRVVVRSWEKKKRKCTVI